MNLSMPGKAEAFVMQTHGIRLTGEDPLPGYVVAQYTRHSNRPNCKCNRQGKLHGPYYCRIWFEGDTPDSSEPTVRRRKEYIPLKEVRSVLARCRQYCIDNASIARVHTLSDTLNGEPSAHIPPRDLRRKWAVPRG